MTSKDPRLSVVMPTRNQATFIVRSIASIFEQRIPSLEVIVQDGCSTDGTQDLLAQLAQSYPDLRWASEPDSGPADAVNRGVAKARAPVIGWLNSDDLYAPGALRRALAYLDMHPDSLMVYGEAEHVDENGSVIARYPTLRPDRPLPEWGQGCGVCQPTALFRRTAFLDLGGLDTGLKTAFDFDFWLRLWKTHPGAMGFLPQVQALSRLHAGSITVRMRETVALEGLQVLHRHLGFAPPHWLLTHFEEVKTDYPWGPISDLGLHFQSLVDRAADWLATSDIAFLRASIRADRALALASPHHSLGVYPDGGAGPEMEVRIQQPTAPLGTLRLHCRSVAPRMRQLRLSVFGPDDRKLLRTDVWRRRFVLDLPLVQQIPGARFKLRVHSEDSFVPARFERGSTDERALSYVVERVETLRAP